MSTGLEGGKSAVTTCESARSGASKRSPWQRRRKNEKYINQL